MSDVIGRGVIEMVVDAAKAVAGIDDVNRAMKRMGDSSSEVSKSTSNSIDRYIKRLDVQAATVFKSKDATELYTLAARGASKAQLEAAESALRWTSTQEALKAGFLTLTAVAAAAAVALVVAFDALLKKTADFQQLAEKTGDTATNLVKLSMAAAVSRVTMDDVAGMANRLTKSLSGSAEGSKDVAAALDAIGISFDDIKNQTPTDRFLTLAKALDQFQNSSTKSAVSMVLLGKSGADVLPFLNELNSVSSDQVVITAEQIRLADEYEKSQLRVNAKLGIYASLIALQMVPAFNALKTALLESTKRIFDLDDSTKALAKNNAIATFAKYAGLYIAALGDQVYFVAQGFHALGDSLGALASAAEQLARGQSKAAKQTLIDAKENLKSLQFNLGLVKQYRQEVAKLESPVFKAEEQKKATERTATEKAKPLIKFNANADDDAAKKISAAKAAETKAQRDAAMIQDAQRAFELSKTKLAADAEANIFDNARKTIAAIHAAGLFTDKQYYAAQRELITEQTRVTEEEIQRQIKAFKEAKFENKDPAINTKDQIENAKALGEAQSKLTKLRQDSANELYLLSVSENASASRLQQAYKDSMASAQDYLDVLKQANAEAFANVGRGAKERERVTQRAAVGADYDKQLRDIEKIKLLTESISGQSLDPETQKIYDEQLRVIKVFQAKALAEFDKGYAERLATEQNWVNGASRALQDYYDKTQDVASNTANAFTSAFQQMEDALVNFVKTGKLDFSKLADSIISDLLRIQVQKSITGPLSKVVESGLGGLGDWFSGLFQAKGGIFGPNGRTQFAQGSTFKPGVQRFATGGTFTNSVVTEPTLFKYATGAGFGIGEMGEAGAEAILPLARSASGDLGVKSTGAGGNLVVNIIEAPGQGGQTNRRTENGANVLDVFVEQIKRSLASDITRGTGAVPGALVRTYGLNRAVGAY